MRLLSLAAVVTVAGCSVKETPRTTDSTAAASARAASAPAAAAAAAPNVVNITASEYKFDAPAEVPAGMTTFTLTNGGKQIHHASLIKLDSGKTMADLMAGLKAMKPGTPPAGWVIPADGANAGAPGNSTSLRQTSRREDSRSYPRTRHNSHTRCFEFLRVVPDVSDVENSHSSARFQNSDDLPDCGVAIGFGLQVVNGETAYNRIDTRIREWQRPHVAVLDLDSVGHSFGDEEPIVVSWPFSP